MLDTREVPVITCPHCNEEFELSEALNAHLHAKFAAAHRRETEALVAQAAKKASEDVALKLKLLENELANERKRREANQQVALEAQKLKLALERRTQELDTEVAQRAARAAQQQLTQQVDAARRNFAEQHDLKLKEKERVIEELRVALVDAQRKSEQGSQQRQGTVLEVNVQGTLEQRFPRDIISPVPKGVRGADFLQQVCDAGWEYGKIIWETKNTKHWQPAWLDKLKEDQRAVGANLAVIVSAVLPDTIVEFGRIDGVWVCGLHAWPSLAEALRVQLIQVGEAYASVEGKEEKKEELYDYIVSDQFRNQVQAMADSMNTMRMQVNKERRAMERIWAEREKQIDRVMKNNSKMFGTVRGIIGQSLLPNVPALELPLQELQEIEEVEEDAVVDFLK